MYVQYNGERITARSPNAPIPISNNHIPQQLQRSNTSSSTSSSSSGSSSDSSEDEETSRLQTINGQRLDRSTRRMLRDQRKAERKQRKADRKHERKMAKIDRKHKKAQRKYPNMPDLPASPQRVQSSTSTIQPSCVPRQTGARGGYLLVIAPLSTAATTLIGESATTTW